MQYKLIKLIKLKPKMFNKITEHKYSHRGEAELHNTCNKTLTKTNISGKKRRIRKN